MDMGERERELHGEKEEVNDREKNIELRYTYIWNSITLTRRVTCDDYDITYREM